MWTAVHVYVQETTVEIQTPTHSVEPDGPQHDCPAAFVIAQQYSSAAFFSQCFYSPKRKFGTYSKNVINSLLTFLTKTAQD
jgi:hypothetical protein